MRVIERSWFRTTFLLLTLSVLFVGDAWRFTFGWVAFGTLAVASGVASVGILILYRGRWRLGTLPYPLLVFLALATVSVAWSAYPTATLLGLLTTWLIATAATAMAIGFQWREIVGALSLLFKIVLAASLAFELFVSLVIRAPILPLYTQPGVDYSIYDTIPKMLYWSRNELFDVLGAGRIQGIVGNANNLGLIALLAVIVFAIQIADRTVRKPWGFAWLALAALTVLFTRSATITVALIAAVAVTAAVLLLRRARTGKARAVTVASILAVVAIGGASVAAFSTQLLALLGKSGDFTGRVGIWQSVLELASQRAVAGWGWVSFWMPWAAPFDNLAFRNGVRQLQAHNAWIDVFL
ncbi:MAG: O-antigen ligase family protein, partial [Rhodoglobus sp.]